MEAVDCRGLTCRPAARRSTAISDPAATDKSAPAIPISHQAAAAAAAGVNVLLTSSLIARLQRQSLLPCADLNAAASDQSSVIFTTTNDD